MKKPAGSYIYISTTDPAVLERCGSAVPGRPAVDGARRVFFASPEGSSDRYVSVVNDIGDHDIEEIRRRLNSGSPANHGFDSHVSAAFHEPGGFTCTGDFFCINTHYWHFDEKTFICSDNIFMVASITASPLSRESFFEHLFFLNPVKERTWFSGINRLRPGQSLSYYVEGNSLSVSDASEDLYNIVKGEGGPDLGEAVDLFFEGAKRVTAGRTAAVSVSSGTDSNTILGCVRGAGIPLRCYSFGAPFMAETRDIARNARRLGFEWTLVDTTKFETSWIERFRGTIGSTNGLLNPYRTHYDEYYRAMHEGAPVFEGVLGSQLVKGDYPTGSAVGKAHRLAVTTGRPLGEIIESEFAFLPERTRNDMSEYISDTHGGWLLDVNTEAGALSFCSFVLEFTVGRMLAGMVLLGSLTRDMYEPFTSPMILGALYRDGLGMLRELSLKNRQRKLAEIIRPEALIAQRMDRGVYGMTLSKGISFRESLTMPDDLIRLLSKYRRTVKKYRHRKRLVAQVDNRDVMKETREYAAALSGRHEFIDLMLRDDGLTRESATYGMILETLGR